MKKIYSYFIMALCLLGTTFATSCGSDDDEPTTLDPSSVVETDVYDVTNTTWSTTDKYSGGYSISTKVVFGVSTAQLKISYVSGQSEEITTYNFNYKRSKRFVLLTPQEDDIATFEGYIDESGIKMELKNTSKGTVIATVYKN